MGKRIEIKVERYSNESWRECVIRKASPWGLQAECLRIFDRLIADGEDEARAAFIAMYDWDLGLEVGVDG